jgi:TonB family protein
MNTINVRIRIGKLLKVSIYLMLLLLLMGSCSKGRIVEKETKISEIQPPVLLRDVKLFYPQEAREIGLEGHVGLNLFIDTTGTVEIVRIVSSSNIELLDQAAVQYAKMLHFMPAQKAGKPIYIWLSWNIVYDLIQEGDGFKLNSYVNEIIELLQKSEQCQNIECDNLYKEILNKHQDFIDYAHQYPSIKYHRDIQKFLSPTIIDKWQPFWGELPFTFVVLQDFLYRFSESNLASEVIHEMMNTIDGDITIIDEWVKNQKYPEAKKHEFYQALYQYLNEKYPELLNQRLKLKAQNS